MSMLVQPVAAFLCRRGNSGATRRSQVAVSSAIGQVLPMVVCLCGVLVWKEFQAAKLKVKRSFTAIMACRRRSPVRMLDKTLTGLTARVQRLERCSPAAGPVRRGETVILEVGILTVRPGEEAAFEAALKAAQPLIAATPGFGSIAVCRCVEAPNQYLLQVRWRSLEDHTIGFRQSDRFQRWRELLHHFYDPPPLIQHYGESVLDVKA